MNESYLTPAVSGRERVGFPSLESIALRSRQWINGSRVKKHSLFMLLFSSIYA